MAMIDLRAVQEAVRTGKFDNALVSLVESYRPYGLNFSSIYHSIHADQSIGLNGRNVLELGGALPSSWVFDFLGASSWTAVESEIYEQLIPGGNQYLQISAQEIERPSYSYCSKGIQSFVAQICGTEQAKDHQLPLRFDRVYSVAAFEHIENLSAALDACSQICQPGALFYSYFTPIWCAPYGHHLGKYEVPELPPYWHLANTPQSAFRYFLKTGHDSSLSQSYVNSIFRNPHINRLTTYDYDLILASSPWEVLLKRPINRKSLSDLDADTSDAIKFLNPSLSYLCDGYWLVLRLP